jgi:putative transposase
VLLPTKLYHIYNRANGKENLFITEENYVFFLQKFSRFILPIAEVYSYCLLPNHFHFLLRIKTIEETICFIENITKSYNISPEEKIEYSVRLYKLNLLLNDKNKQELYQKFISKQFSNLFSSYTQAFNKKYDRMGSLFMKNFKRKEIDHTAYLSAAIKYIHRNPIHHGIVNHLSLWKWSSYSAYTTSQPTNICKDEILSWFGSLDAIIESHKISVDSSMEKEFEFL